jgi:SAM-dependent methyltransferase
MSYQTVQYPGLAPRVGERDVSPRFNFYRREDFDGRYVIDFGCAEGGDCVYIANKFQPKRAIGIDVDPKAITEARELASAWSVQGKTLFVCADALMFLMTGMSDWRLLGCTFLLNSVVRWIGPEKIMDLVNMIHPTVIYCESHSEDDIWTRNLKNELAGKAFTIQELGSLAYTIKDPRPSRRFYRCEAPAK